MFFGIQVCNFDGGDCCAATCVPGTGGECVEGTFNCRDGTEPPSEVQYVEHGVMSYLVFVVGCPEATDMYSHRHLRIVYISLSSWLCGLSSWLCGQQCGHLPTQFCERLSSRCEGKVLRCPSDPTESCIQPRAPFLIIVVDAWRPHCVRGSLRRCFFGFQ